MANSYSLRNSSNRQYQEEPSELSQAGGGMPGTTDDSFLKRDLEKLKMMWKNVKDNRANVDQITYDGMTLNEDEMGSGHTHQNHQHHQMGSGHLPTGSSGMYGNTVGGQSKERKYSYATQGSEKKYTGEDERFVEGGKLAYGTKSDVGAGTRYSATGGSRNPHTQDPEAEVRSLRDKLAFSESRLIKLQEFNKNLFEKLNKAEEELANAFDKLAKQNYQNQVKQIEIDDLNTKMSAVSIGQQSEIDSLKGAYENLKVGLIEKQYQIEKLENLLRDRDEELDRFRGKQEMFSEREFETVMRENKQLRDKIADTERNLDNLYLLRKNESAILLENERQKEDIKRLLDLLKQTSEFEEFATKANLLDGEIRFLPHSHKANGGKRHKSVDIDKHQQQMNAAKKSGQESLFWIPLDAFKFAHDLRLKFKGEFNEEILEMILFEMSKIWRAKEDKIITSLKDKHQKEINLIKQKYQSYGDYNGIVQKKMASRLKGELQKSKKELHSAKKMGKTTEIGILADTIKGVTENYNKAKTLEVQNKILVNRLRKLKEENVDPNQTSTYFAEGANWIYDSLQHEVQKLLYSISDVINDYNAKIRDIEDTESDESKYTIAVNRNKYALERIEDIMNNLFGSFRSLKKKIDHLEAGGEGELGEI